MRVRLGTGRFTRIFPFSEDQWSRIRHKAVDIADLPDDGFATYGDEYQEEVDAAIMDAIELELTGMLLRLQEIRGGGAEE